MKKTSIYFIYLIIALNVFSQDQKLQFEKIKLLPKTINSSADELMPIISNKGNSLFFVRAAHSNNIGGKLGNQDIWQSTKKADGSWAKALPFNVFNNKGNNAIVGINVDDQRIYLLNSYEDNYGTKSGLSYSDYNDENWQPPVITKIEGIYNLETKNDIYGLSVNRLSDVLLISMKGPQSLGKEDLYVSFKFTGWNRFHNANKNGDDIGKSWWSPPIHLGDKINSAGYDISPFLSEDGKTLFFASNRKGGYGDADIYYSTRLDDSWTNWTIPINLGRTINSRKFDGYFFLKDDSTVLFSSARSGRLAEIYTTKLIKSNTEILKTRHEIYAPVQKTYSKVKVAEPIMMADNQIQLDLMNSIDRNILFDHNSSNLLLKDLDILTSTINILKFNTNLEVRLIGHTDQIGSFEENNILAKKRAAEVKKYFSKKGIATSRIIVESAGESIPIANNEDPQGRELNRRVELHFEIMSN